MEDFARRGLTDIHLQAMRSWKNPSYRDASSETAGAKQGREAEEDDGMTLAAIFVRRGILHAGAKGTRRWRKIHWEGEKEG